MYRLVTVKNRPGDAYRSLIMLEFVTDFAGRHLFGGAPRKIRFTDRGTPDYQIMRPIVMVQNGVLAAGAEVFENIEQQNPTSSMLFKVGNADLFLAYRLAAVMLNLGPVFNRQAFDARIFSYLILDIQVTNELVRHRQESCLYLGIDPALADSFATLRIPQAQAELIYAHFKTCGIRYEVCPIQREIHVGCLEFSPAFGQLGVADPALQNRHDAHAESVCQPMMGEILYTMNLLRIDQYCLDDIKRLIGQAVRKGIKEPHLALGMAIYRNEWNEEDPTLVTMRQRLSQVIHFMNMWPADAKVDIFKIAGALAVTFSQKGTLADHRRGLQAILDAGWKNLPERDPV